MLFLSLLIAFSGQSTTHYCFPLLKTWLSLQGSDLTVSAGDAPEPSLSGCDCVIWVEYLDHWMSHDLYHNDHVSFVKIIDVIYIIVE
jgi:hypothetical protein